VIVESALGVDFCCFADVTWKLAKSGLTFVVGEHRDSAASNSNGTGKSTLFELVAWGLFGETIDTTLKGDAQKLARFNKLLRERGIFKGDSKFYTSLAHDDTDINQTLEAFAAVAKTL